MNRSDNLTSIWLRIIQKVQASDEGTTMTSLAKDLKVDIGHLDWRINHLVESEILSTNGERIWPNKNHFLYPSDDEILPPDPPINWTELILGWILGQISLYSVLVFFGIG
ncbi:MAG: hypothetical protein EAX81_05835 [Candidatus Thorarchaeota archaeon]|nr:hypothetical protein [Candidatus Thorarchaeota archaeon]